MKNLILFTVLALGQSAFSADVVISPGKQTNINGTSVACQSSKASNLAKLLAADDKTLLLSAFGGIGSCKVAKETWKAGHSNSYYYLKINDNRVIETQDNIDLAVNEIVPTLRKLISAGGCE